VPHVAVALADGATPQDVCAAALHAAHLRRCVVERIEGPLGGGASGSGSSSIDEARNGTPAERRAALEVAALSAEELEQCAAEAGRRARRDAKRFMRDVTAAGWKTQRLLLSPSERTGYSLQP
jgi:hypothetical protein